ncbi:Ribosomal protein L17 [Blastocystis hominis]|uniref:Ribosomal protein L17 n=1 Tax=Blastocystis hominis TaxID=12968 RepID=D8M047_BLAHO|nr:Ribosomal protein L17 [Blastocystis hominis]CBK21436.2 Ribosomal protein L17 [Blastocystis hominis]|eukprot:XP_012895484.1 Ribosomal protein L17 [Blastocystis hominis]
MKHRVIFRKLGRKTSHRTAMLRNLTTSLIEHDRIRTTVTRAKEVRRVADQMVTLAKKGTDYARQRAAVTVKTDEAMEKLFDTIAGRYKFFVFLFYDCF